MDKILKILLSFLMTFLAACSSGNTNATVKQSVPGITYEMPSSWAFDVEETKEFDDTLDEKYLVAASVYKKYDSQNKVTSKIYIEVWNPSSQDFSNEKSCFYGFFGVIQDQFDIQFVKEMRVGKTLSDGFLFTASYLNKEKYFWAEGLLFQTKDYAYRIILELRPDDGLEKSLPKKCIEESEKAFLTFVDTITLAD